MLNICAALIISVFVIFAFIIAGLKIISAIMLLLFIMALVWSLWWILRNALIARRDAEYRL
jgi:hypothetical protein